MRSTLHEDYSAAFRVKIFPQRGPASLHNKDKTYFWNDIIYNHLHILSNLYSLFFIHLIKLNGFLCDRLDSIAT